MKRILILSVLIPFAFTSCDPGYSPIENAVYLGEAQQSSSKNVTIGKDGAETNVYASVAFPESEDVTVSIVTDESVLARYNSRNGSNYLLLPESYYEFSSDKMVIKAGELSSDVCGIRIKPFDSSLEVSEKYAIPVRLTSADGIEVLESSSEMIIICDKIIETKIFYTASNKVAVYDVEEGDVLTDNLNTWTIEFLSYCESFKLNKHNLEIRGADGKVVIFCRYGEYDHPVDEIQFKVLGIPFYGVNRYQPKKWNHVALTCDGSVLKLYQNGKLDLTVDYPEPGKTVTLRSFDIRQGNIGAMSEFRLWGTVRSQAEIEHNMYAVNPKTEGLITYWKMDEGEGKVFHDATGNGRDAEIKANGTWKDQVFPPEE